MMNSQKTGEFIAELRKQKKITQNELADLLGVTNKAVSRWETGEGYPEITLLPRLAIILGVTVDEILNGEKKDQEKRVSSRTLITKYESLFYASIIALLAFYVIGVALAYITFYEWLGLVAVILGILGSISVYFYARYCYLKDCEYTLEDRRIIFKYSSIYYFVLFFVMFAYAPLIFQDPNLLGYGYVPSKAILSFSSYMGSVIIWGPISILFSTLVNAVHRIIVFKRRIDFTLFLIPVAYIIGFVVFHFEEGQLLSKFTVFGYSSLEFFIFTFVLLLVLILIKKLDILVRSGLVLIALGFIVDFIIFNGVDNMKDGYTGKLIVSCSMLLIYVIYLLYMKLSNKVKFDRVIKYGFVIPLFCFIRIFNDIALINYTDNNSLVNPTFNIFLYSLFVIISVSINLIYNYTNKNKLSE